MAKAKRNGRTAYSYVRFSSPKQLKGDSLRRQAAASADYCRRNGLRLDSSMTLKDMGVSAYRGRNVKEGALAAFLEAVQNGQIPTGSVLIVESIDRLSREQIGDALSLFISILSSGVNIVTLSPEREYSKASINNIAVLIEPIIYMSRAHEESATKGQRVGAAWQRKRQNIGQQKLTASCPRWLELAADRKSFRTIPAAVAIVKRIFKMAADGYGCSMICRKLNAEGLPSIGRAAHWYKSYLIRILRGREVLGEYQPHSGQSGSRKPIGEPITNYYPRIISDELYYSVQAAMTNRQRQQRGRRGKHVSNIFTGLLRDSNDKSTLIMTDKGKGVKYLVSSHAQRGIKGSRYISIPYAGFEQIMLNLLIELTPADILPKKADGSAAKLAAAEGQLAKVETKISKAKAALAADADFDSIVDVLRTLEQQRQQLATTVEQLRGEIHNGHDESLENIGNLYHLISTATGDRLTDIRTKIKQQLNNLISVVWIRVSSTNRQQKRVSASIHFRSGKKRNFSISFLNGKCILLTSLQPQRRG